MKEEINYILESLRFKTSIYRDRKKRNLTFNDDEYYANILNEYIENLQSQLKAKEEVIKEAREAINKMINTGYSDGTTLYFSTSNKSEFGVRAKIIDKILSKGENK
jgi:hypothetical protein